MRIAIRSFALGALVALTAALTFLSVVGVTRAATWPAFSYAPQVATTSLPADIVTPAHDVTHALNWAGYIADTDGHSYTEISGTWRVPSVSQGSLDGTTDLNADATWVGIGGVRSHDLIQAGTEAIEGSDGVTYQTWYELLPGVSNDAGLSVSPGDLVTVSITQTQPDVWRISFVDHTTGQSTSIERTYASSLSSAEWIEEMPSAVDSVLGLDNFGSVVFVDGYVIDNGSTVSIKGANARAVTMSNGSGDDLATPSVIGGDGQSFSVVRSANPSTPVLTSRRRRLYDENTAGQMPWVPTVVVGDDGSVSIVFSTL